MARMSINRGAAGGSRREFIRRAGATLLFAGAGSAAQFVLPLQAADETPGPKPVALVGSNIYGWGQYYERDKKKLDVAEVLSALRDTGYDYLERNLDLEQPDNNARFAEEMIAKGLKPVSLYTGAHLHEADKTAAVVGKILTAAKASYQAGFRVLSCNPDPIGREKTDDELKNQAAGLTDLGKGLKEIGIRLGVHNHTPEMLNQAREFHYNFDHTDPRQVGFCFDVHWVFRGGVKPLEALNQYGNRVVSWHLRQSRDGVWWEDLADGDIDYEAVASYARAHRLARLYTVELALESGTKITRSVVENHRRSREFVRRVFES
jgi:inosose dehydratase